MKRSKQYIVMATAIAMLFTASCQQGEVIDSNDTSTGELKFSPSLGEAETVTRAGESDNDVLQKASAAGGNLPHIVIETYTGTPGSSLQKYFSDELGYFESEKNWDINSKKVHFLPSGGMHLYAYFATDLAGKGKLDDLEYIVPSAPDKHPSLTFEVAAEAVNQVDLIAAKVEEINSSEVLIPFRHILSQINFGVKGMDGFQITVKNIRINAVKNSGIFDYKALGWTPDAMTTAYPYHFPNRVKDDANSGLGDQYKTQGTPDDSQNIYLFGDGGKFGPGDDAKFLYAQTDPTVSHYATKEDTPTPLHNSLMLLPQEITKNTDATVTFDYEIRSKGEDKIVRSSKDNTVRLDAYYDWEPNYRYVYLFEFDDPSQKVTFDVLAEPWAYYDGDKGIVGTDELNGTTLFQKYVSPLKAGESYSVPIGTLTSDFLCDWSLYTLKNSFSAGEAFSISFGDLPFKNGKSVLINPPFGFTASTPKLSAKGTVTFTPIKSYYSSSADVNTAVSGKSGNFEFYVNDAVKLNEINFTGSVTEERTLALHFLSPYMGTPPTRWNKYDETTFVCFPNDFAVSGNSYTVYTVQGLKAVFDWMNNGGDKPGGGDSSLSPVDRMKTNITLVENGKYNLSDVYANATNGLTTPFVPIGKSEAEKYTGTFDGKGATISNLYLNADWTGTERGFFGNVSGRVQYVNLSNVSIVATGDWFVGGLIGFNRGGTVIGCSVQGSIQGSTGNGVTGGLFGQNSGFVYASSSTATINGASPGGIAGDNWGQIHGCYVTNGKNIAGVNNNTISSSYYVATLPIGTDFEGVTRIPSIATLNGKISQLNKGINAQYIIAAHFISGDLNNTPPTAAPGTVVGAGGGVLKGTFIQNSHALPWGQEKWNEEMAVLATLGMEYLVLDQVMEYSDYAGNSQYISWYKPSTSVLVNEPISKLNASETALEFCMNACRTHGIKLFIGTFFDKRYWDDGKAITNPSLWNNCITTSNNIMKDLTSLYFSTGSTKNYTDVLAGWYFPYEVDDLYFQTTDAQTLLKNGIKTAITCRDELTATAKKPYLFSPFMNGSGPFAIKEPTMNATQYAALWEGIIKETGFQNGDILSPQDCIGTGKFVISDIHDWMPKLRDVAKAKGVEFWVNVELFAPDGSASNVSDLTGQQIPASNAYATKLISFSYPIHYSPNSDRKGDHKAYKAYYDAQ